MVDTKCNFLKGKYRKQECCSAFSSDGPSEDENLLRQPLRTSCAGYKEAKHAYENGTDEVRRLLLQECSLIYECNVCRNMFRSLANFIGHKRNYCKTTSTDIYSFPDRNSSVIIQSVKRAEPLFVKSRSTGSSPIPNTKCSNRDLSRVIERLKRVEVSSDKSNVKAEVMEQNAKATWLNPKYPEPVLELESVPTTTQAVYQTLKFKSDEDSIKTELDEVHNLLGNQKTLLGPDGRAITNPELMLNASTINCDKILDKNKFKDASLLSRIFCKICKIQFQTEKTLKMHVQKHHSTTTYVFQCPTCSMTFLQPSAVIRHLANEHKKPLRRIRKMRETILKKRIQIGDVQMKGLGREVERLQMTNTKDFNTSDNDGRSITSCTYCFKNFERRAVLATHLTNCLARKMLVNKPDHSSKISVPQEHKNEAKIQNQISNQVLEYDKLNDKIMNVDKPVTKLNIKQEPQEDLSSAADSSNINEMFENLETQTFGNGLHTVSLDKIEMMEECERKYVEGRGESVDKNSKADNCDDKSSKTKIKKNKLINRHKPLKKEKSKRFRIVSASKQLTCRCKICNKQFNALSNLRRHISMFHYRSRRFGCSLCDYRAFRRYDIVNHLTFVHKMTGERESIAVEYVTVHELKYSKDDVDGDIVVVNDEAAVVEQRTEKPETAMSEIATKTYEKRGRSKKVLSESNEDILQPLKIDLIVSKDKSHGKVVRRKFKNSLEQQIEGKNRPIRNRIKTVNKDFVYDLLTVKEEEEKKPPRLALKRRSTVLVAENNLSIVEFIPPPIKISPYRLRTEPLIPANKSSIRGFAANVFRNIIHEGLAAPSTLPDLPTQRPQMRPRVMSSSRNDSNTVPIIETSELEAAGLKSTFFDDSFLERFAKKSNPSFKMKPLLALQHSPLNSILQKFDASQQNKNNRIEHDNSQNSSKKDSSPPPDYTICLLQSLTKPSLNEKYVTPNGKQIFESVSHAAPKKRITLMERLAENRARAKKGGDSIICNALDN